MNSRFLTLSFLIAASGLALRPGELPAAPADANYDESKVPAYTLPDPLTREDGTKVTSAAEWPARRAEIYGLFEKHVYGRIPGGAFPGQSARVLQTIPDFLGGKATLKEVRIFLTGKEEGLSMDMLLVIPNKPVSPAPVFLALNFRGNHSVHPDPRIHISQSWMRPDKEGRVIDNRSTGKARGAAASRWPVETLIDRGYALATIYYGDIDPDFDDDFQNGIHPYFFKDGQKKPGPDQWGSIGAWAWGLSRGLDYLETDDSIDAKKVAVLGHSRLGKTSLWAGASDERFALVISNDSGCGGAALSRRAFGETVKRINTSFPHWFCDNFVQYNDNESALPVDQHQLIALIAPRPVYVASAVDDQWADPKGEFLSAKHAGEVYALFGKKGVGVDEQPPVDQPAGDFVRYHVRTGKHDVTDFDWAQYLDFADRHLR